jgi:serine/threonine-protein kinase HipA
LSPAYDLLNVSILNPDDKEELALTIEGKKKKLKLAHFEKLGQGLGLSNKQLSGVFKRFIANKETALSMLEQSFLSAEMKAKYRLVLIERYEHLFR